jgi:hypothetical protein
MYLIKQVPKDARKLEMCFDCNAFQYQLNQNNEYKDHVFQVNTTPYGAYKRLKLTFRFTDDLFEQEA